MKLESHFLFLVLSFCEACALKTEMIKNQEVEKRIVNRKFNLSTR